MASTLTIGDGYSRLAEHPEFLDQPLYRATVEPEEIRRLKTEESAPKREPLGLVDEGDDAGCPGE